jgi:hypothetical protein
MARSSGSDTSCNISISVSGADVFYMVVDPSVVGRISPRYWVS